MASEAAPPVRVRLELLQQNRTMVMQRINLPALLPILESHGVFTPEEIARLKDEHHSLIERMNFLLQYIFKKGQSVADEFMQCLREEASHWGHQEILQILEKGASDRPEMSPVLEILEDQVEVIERYLNLNSFLNLITTTGVFQARNLLDINDPYRTPRENVSRLVRLVQNQGVKGLISFLKCLQEDHQSASHQRLARILLEEVTKFLKTSPDRSQVASSDKIALMQLETMRAVTGKSLEQEFDRNRTKLLEGIDLPHLLPSLRKRDVLTAEEAERFDREQPSKQNEQLLEVARAKGGPAILGLLECLREDPKHQELAKLFEVTSGPAKPTRGAGPALVRRKVPSVQKTDRLAVMVCMDSYVDLCPITYRPLEKRMDEVNKSFRQHREDLRTCLHRMDYQVVDLNLTEEEDQEEEEGEEGKKKERARRREYTSRVGEIFQKEVVNRCGKDAIVFIYISGIQFPFRDATSDYMRHDSYQGAVLIQGSSEISRKRLDCLRAQDLCHWVEQLPTDYITFLIDCDQSNVVQFGKNKEPKEIEIMEDPWRPLTNFHSSVVVYFTRPDPEAMGRQRGQESSRKPHFGLLTEKFVTTMMSWIRRTRPDQVTHRLFYESISFHWHKHGRTHLLYNPAAQGDVDRAFLAKSSSPYHQVFRANLVKIDPLTSSSSFDKFKLKEMEVATGTMAGLIRGDELEVFHILRPETIVAGRVTKANPLSAIAEISDKDMPKFTSLLFDIYEDDNGSKDGSTEFVFVKKRFPFHQREQYSVFVDQDVGESDAETVKSYIRESSMLLSVAVKKEMAKMVVKKDGQFYIVDDVGRDVRAKEKAERIQLVKSMLESMAWFKYVKGLKQQLQKPPHTHVCHMTSEKALLSKSVPQSLEYQLRCTSHVAPYSIEEGAILDFAEPKFWISAPPSRDGRPCLEIAFKQNHVVAAVELRGDPATERYVEKGVIAHQKLVDTVDKKTVFEGLTAGTPVRTINLHCQEPVKFVTFVPESWTQGKDFNLTLRMSHRTASAPGQKGATIHTIDGMTVVNWPFYKQKWKFVPTPNQETGHIKPNEWLSWTGNTYDPVTFDLKGAFLLDKIEATVTEEGASPLERFRLELHTQWLHEDLPPVQSVWPMKHHFPTPLLASNLQLWPVNIRGDEARVQLQFYGNKFGESLVVEEGDLLTLHFTNTGHLQLFVYVFCLEETGAVKFVLMDVVKKGQSCQKFIKTYIPDGYSPVSRQIVDLYKVFVSPRKMYLEPFVQRGLTEYHRTCCYSVCSMGRRTDLGKDEQWYKYEFTVRVKQASHLKTQAN